MESRKVYPVSVVNRYVKTVLDRDETLENIWISGEISNFKRHGSGHLYFTLKDASGAINAVMFAGDARRLRFLPENGMKLQARGAVTLYEKTGGYQFYVKQMEEAGTGDLYREFERLKTKLEQEGLFDSSLKKPIPRFPRRVGIITSPTGAAVRDIIQISRRRNPGISLVLYPALVQGSGAAETIVRGLRILDRMPEVDVIIAGRGGGSMEDLWPFNEEIVARAIAACSTPVISAVGHETDFTIADFVSDLRAPTPSAAAELAVCDVPELMRGLDVQRERQEERIRHFIGENRIMLDLQKSRLVHLSPQTRIRENRMNTDRCSEMLERQIRLKLTSIRRQLDKESDALKFCSPLFPLEKGYALLEDEKGSILSSVGQTVPDQTVYVRLQDGKLETKITKILRASYDGQPTDF